MGRIIYAICHFILTFLFRIFFGFKVKGRHHIPRRGGVIVAANHLSFLDPPVLGTALPRPAHYMARHDLFSFPIWGRFLRLVNAFPIRREGIDRQALRKAIEYLRQGKVLILFPEGTRSLSGELLPPLPGVGMMASEGRAVIVPAYIKGTDKALPPQAKFIKFRRVEVTLGKPFSPEKLFSSSLPKREIYDKITHHLMAEIKRLKESGLKHLDFFLSI